MDNVLSHIDMSYFFIINPTNRLNNLWWPTQKLRGASKLHMQTPFPVWTSSFPGRQEEDQEERNKDVTLVYYNQCNTPTFAQPWQNCPNRRWYAAKGFPYSPPPSSSQCDPIGPCTSWDCLVIHSSHTRLRPQFPSMKRMRGYRLHCTGLTGFIERTSTYQRCPVQGKEWYKCNIGSFFILVRI